MGEFIQVAEVLFRAGYELVSYDKHYNKELQRYEVDIKVCRSADPPPGGDDNSPSPL